MDHDGTTASLEGKHLTSMAVPSDEGLKDKPWDDQPQDLELNNEKRKETRFLCNDPAEVRTLMGDARFTPATVLDISRSGLRLEMASCLLKGMEVEIKLQRSVIIFGEVRYFKRASNGFQIGVSISEVFYARGTFISDHLHDDQLLLYIARKGLTAAEVLAVRNHLRGCKVCSNQYDAATELRERLARGFADE